MMEVQEKKHRIEKNSDEPKTIKQTTNNLVFTGTTSDMLKALKKENEKIIDHDSIDPHYFFNGNMEKKGFSFPKLEEDLSENTDKYCSS